MHCMQEPSKLERAMLFEKTLILPIFSPIPLPLPAILLLHNVPALSVWVFQAV